MGEASAKMRKEAEDQLLAKQQQRAADFENKSGGKGRIPTGLGNISWPLQRPCMADSEQRQLRFLGLLACICAPPAGKLLPECLLSALGDELGDGWGLMLNTCEHLSYL